MAEWGFKVSPVSQIQVLNALSNLILEVTTHYFYCILLILGWGLLKAILKAVFHTKFSKIVFYFFSATFCTVIDFIFWSLLLQLLLVYYMRQLSKFIPFIWLSSLYSAICQKLFFLSCHLCQKLIHHIYRWVCFQNILFAIPTCLNNHNFIVRHENRQYESSKMVLSQNLSWIFQVLCISIHILEST